MRDHFPRLAWSSWHTGYTRHARRDALVPMFTKRAPAHFLLGDLGRTLNSTVRTGLAQRTPFSRLISQNTNLSGSGLRGIDEPEAGSAALPCCACPAQDVAVGHLLDVHAARSSGAGVFRRVDLAHRASGQFAGRGVIHLPLRAPVPHAVAPVLAVDGKHQHRQERHG